MRGCVSKSSKRRSLMVQFECNDCVFRKDRKRHPFKDDHQDALTKACIRRILLDAFWSRASTTVTGHANKIDLGIKLCDELGIELPYQNSGPLPENDHCGYAVALQMVLQWKASGKYAEDHQQWDTIRKLGPLTQIKCEPALPQIPSLYRWVTSTGNLTNAFRRMHVHCCGFRSSQLDANTGWVRIGARIEPFRTNRCDT